MKATQLIKALQNLIELFGEEAEVKVLQYDVALQQDISGLEIIVYEKVMIIY